MIEQDELSLEQVQRMIEEECDGIKNLLIQKNQAYGNSAIYPKRIFSRSSSVEQIKVRIDDKLSRMMSDHISGDEKIRDEDVTKDLMGYLILLRIAEKLHGE